MENMIIICIVLIIVAAIITYLVRAKKRGETCIGCPYGKQCSGHLTSSQCSCHNMDDNH